MHLLVVNSHSKWSKVIPLNQQPVAWMLFSIGSQPILFLQHSSWITACNSNFTIFGKFAPTDNLTRKNTFVTSSIERAGRAFCRYGQASTSQSKGGRVGGRSPLTISVGLQNDVSSRSRRKVPRGSANGSKDLYKLCGYETKSRFN